MMTKADFTMLAAVMRTTKPDAKGVSMGKWLNVMATLAHALEGNYPRFDRKLFEKAVFSHE